MDWASPGSPTSVCLVSNQTFLGQKFLIFGIPLWKCPPEGGFAHDGMCLHGCLSSQKCGNIPKQHIFHPETVRRSHLRVRPRGRPNALFPKTGESALGVRGGKFLLVPGSIALVSFSPPLRFPSQSLTRTSCSASPSPSSRRLSASGYTPAPSPRT